MLQFLQNYPHTIGSGLRCNPPVAASLPALVEAQRLYRSMMSWSEAVVKGAIFDCQMCGQCILRSTGMTCPICAST